MSCYGRIDEDWKIKSIYGIKNNSGFKKV